MKTQRAVPSKWLEVNQEEGRQSVTPVLNFWIETCQCVFLSLHCRCLCWKERRTGKGVLFFSSAALSWYRHQLIHYEMIKGYDGIFCFVYLVVIILTAGLILVCQAFRLSNKITNSGIMQTQKINPDGWISIVDLCLTMFCMSTNEYCRWSTHFFFFF